MKKFPLVLAIMILANGAFAQNVAKAAPPPAKQPVAPTPPSDEFAWGIGLGALAIFGVVVGLTAASAASTPSTHSTAP